MKSNNLLKLLLLVNLIGILYGFYYYLPKFGQTNPLLWPLVPDSPLSILFFVLVLAGIWRGAFASFFASAWMVKYGVWTVFVMLFHPQYYMRPEFLLEAWALFIIPHIGMAFEPVLILRRDFKWQHAAIVLAILLINDFSDYAVGTRPMIPEVNLGIVALVTVLLSVFACAGLLLFSKAALENGIAARIRGVFGLDSPVSFI